MSHNTEPSADQVPPRPQPPIGPNGQGAAPGDTPTSTGSIFDNLDAIRINQDVATSGSGEILRHVPVRKPTRKEYVRVNPDPKMMVATGVFDDSAENETYFVVPELRETLEGELKSVLLTVAINRQGVLFLWPVPLPDEGGKQNSWNESQQEVFGLAKTQWMRMWSDRSLGSYRMKKAEGELSEPVWPKKTLNELLKLGFKGRIIDREDHPIIKQLRGLS